MKNFIGTEYENMTEEEIFLLNEKLVKATIYKKFPNHKAYCRVHMIEFDDLVQQGNIGLLNAIKNYDKNSGSSFRSFAINNIAWEISTSTKKESLRNINTQSTELVDVVSASMPLSEEEDLTVLDTIKSNSDTSTEAEENVMIEKAVKIVENDGTIDDVLKYILIARLNGQTMQNIADKLNVHRNAISRRLKTRKAYTIKNRIASCLGNGDGN